MKISYYLLPAVVTVVLFIVPFFWLSAGEMDLGGDSNRLYFYDPLSYLRFHTVYNVIPSGFGGDAISYYAIPYIILLAVVRIFISGTYTIAIINGLKLSVAFLMVFLIVKDLLDWEYQKRALIKEFGNGALYVSATIAGLFYVLSPVLVNSGWDKAILSHIQIFLNPLMFFLLFRYFTTSRALYLLWFLFISFVFSLNFSYAAAPPFFAFYPLSFLFLFLYTKYIKKKPLPIKGLVVGGSVFFLLNAFHIVPHLFGILLLGSDVSDSVFSENTKLSRGLDYFNAIAPSVKVSLGLLSLAQMRDLVWISFGFIVFPVIILLGFLWNKHNKTLLLTGIIFLIVMFFAIANITDMGMNFYRILFYIPGFKMFRNYFAQWSFAFVFFYALLFGQAIASVFLRIRKLYQYSLAIYIGVLLCVVAWPLLSGKMVNAVNWGSKDIKVPLQIDPQYEQVLDYVRKSMIDGKVLMFPLAGPGYQVFSGKEGGAYVGPPTFSYLGGRSDFSSYDSLGPYNEMFLEASVRRDYEFFKTLFPLMNIRYIFHNSDTRIYDDNFTGFPYDYVRDFLPKTQNAYKEFIKNLSVGESIDFGDKYHLYTISEDTLYLPHMYATDNTVYTTNQSVFPFVSFFNRDLRSAVFGVDNSKKNSDAVILEPLNDDPLLPIKNNSHLHRHKPFISMKLDSLWYPVAILREKISLWQEREDREKFVDLSFYYASKRIAEVENFVERLPFTHETWKEPEIWEVHKWKSYNSWEASLGRYSKQMEDLIQWVNTEKIEESYKEIDRIKISEQLYQHQNILIYLLQKSDKNLNEYEYLLGLINTTFDHLYRKLNLTFFEPSRMTFILDVPRNHVGEYEVYIDNKDSAYLYLTEATLKVGNTTSYFEKTIESYEFVQFKPITISEAGDIRTTLVLKKENLLGKYFLQNSGDSITQGDTQNLLIYNISNEDSGGLIQRIEKWEADKQYIISFEYLTKGENFTFRLFDKQSRDDGGRKLGENVYFEKQLSSTKWEKHQSIVTSDKNTISGFLQFQGSPYKVIPESKMQIKNLSITEVSYPKIYFKKTKNTQGSKQKPPQIVFTRINPTKYKVEVKGAENPYTLVFLEAFSPNWNLIDISQNEENVLGEVLSTMGKFGSVVTSLFVYDNKEKEILASHLGGDVRERKQRNTFLEPATFETWGKKIIAKNNHFRAGAYANGWNIDPKEMQEKTDYTLILEMSTQKQLYILLPLSLVTFMVVTILLILRLLRKK